MNPSSKYDIQFSGLGNGLHEFDWFLDDQFFEDYGNRDILGAELNVIVSLDKQSRTMKLIFHVGGILKTLCDHCGEQLNLEIDTEQELIVRFAEKTDLSGDEVVFLSQSEHSIDLAQYFFEFAVLAIPARKRHDEGECNPIVDKYLIHDSDQIQKNPRWEALEKIRKK